MEKISLIHCSIENDLYISKCNLIKISDTAYKINVIDDPMATFEGFEYLLNRFDKLSDEDAIELFKELCLDAYTCHGSFSIKEVKEHGEEILFSAED